MNKFSKKLKKYKSFLLEYISKSREMALSKFQDMHANINNQEISPFKNYTQFY